MVKLLTVALIGKGYFFDLPKPFLPFFLLFDHIPGLLFQSILNAGAVVFVILLFTNQKVRLSCFVLGTIFLVGTLSSKIYYSNAKVYCGLIYLMTALNENRRRPWLIQLQIIVVYFGAGINKLFEPDWRSGQYFDHWMVNVIQAKFYTFLADATSHEMLSKIFSWKTIVVEIVVLPLTLLFKRWHRVGIWIGMVFHTFAFWLAGFSFEVFYSAILISYISFAQFPSNIIVNGLEWNFSSRLLKDTLQWSDVDNRFKFHDKDSAPQTGGLIIDFNEKQDWIGRLARLRFLLIYHPLTYVIFTLFLTLPFLPNITQHFTGLSCMILFFPFYKPLKQPGEA